MVLKWLSQNSIVMQNLHIHSDSDSTTQTLNFYYVNTIVENNLKQNNLMRKKIYIYMYV